MSGEPLLQLVSGVARIVPPQCFGQQHYLMSTPCHGGGEFPHPHRADMGHVWMALADENNPHERARPRSMIQAIPQATAKAALMPNPMLSAGPIPAR